MLRRLRGDRRPLGDVAAPDCEGENGKKTMLDEGFAHEAVMVPKQTSEVPSKSRPAAKIGRRRNPGPKNRAAAFALRVLLLRPSRALPQLGSLTHTRETWAGDAT